MKLKYRFVFFDVDSTLVTIEGIDELAHGDPEIARLTEQAMNGEVPVDQVYGKRLDHIRPSSDAIDALAAKYRESIVPGARETFARLREAGAQIHLVTGGLAPAILPLAADLGVAPRAVHAVGIRFDDNGAYADFDRRSFLTRPGGKELVVRDVRARSHGKAAFVGDGMTDLEARPAVDLFIGFGGVEVRPRVQKKADVYVSDPSLEAVLPYLFE